MSLSCNHQTVSVREGDYQLTAWALWVGSKSPSGLAPCCRSRRLKSARPSWQRFTSRTKRWHRKRTMQVSLHLNVVTQAPLLCAWRSFATARERLSDRSMERCRDLMSNAAPFHRTLDLISSAPLSPLSPHSLSTCLVVLRDSRLVMFGAAMWASLTNRNPRLRTGVELARVSHASCEAVFFLSSPLHPSLPQTYSNEWIKWHSYIQNECWTWDSWSLVSSNSSQSHSGHTLFLCSLSAFASNAKSKGCGRRKTALDLDSASKYW